MVGDPSSTQRPINLLVLPAETDSRFKLLIAVSLVINAILWFSITALLSSHKIISLPSPTTITVPFETHNDSLIRAALLRIVWVSLPWLALPFFSTLVLMFLTWGLRYGIPAYIRSFYQLTPLPTGADPEIEKEIQNLAGEAGVDSPLILIQKRRPFVHAQIFGRRSPFFLWFSDGMRLYFRKFPRRFQAIVLHELAHLVHQDVCKVYLSLSAWISLTVVAVIPFAVGGIINALIRLFQALSGSSSYTLLYFLSTVIPKTGLLLIQSAGILSLFAVMSSGILRIREQYADWRAARWKSGQALPEMLVQAAGIRNTGLTSIFRFHPSHQERLQTITHPERLFSIRKDLAYFVGFLVGFLLAGYQLFSPFLYQILIASFQFINQVLNQWFIGNPSFSAGLAAILSWLLVLLPMSLALFVIFLGITTLLTSTLAIQVERLTLSELISATPSRNALVQITWAALFFGLGVQTSFFLTPGNRFLPFFYSQIALLKSFLLLPIGLLGFSLPMFFWMQLTRLTSAAVFCHAAESHPPRKLLRSVNFGLGLLLCFLLSGSLVLQSILSDIAVDPGYQTIAWSWFPIITGVGIIMYGLWFLFVWMNSKRTITLRCPKCGQPVAYKTSIGQVCPACQTPLDQWIYL